MIVDILTRKISLINKEYQTLTAKVIQLNLKIKDLEIEKLLAEKDLMETSIRLRELEEEIIKDMETKIIK